MAQNAHSNHLALPPLPWRRAEVALELAPQVQQAGQTDPDKRQYLRFDGCMKTTVDLPEALLVKAKILAAEQRTTLRDLVVEGLKRVTESRNEDTKKHVSPP